MKSFFLFILLMVAVSIACTGYKSAGSPTVSNHNAPTPQLSPQNESAPTQDKPKCTLTLASFPAINGVKMRMTTDEVLALFSGSKEDPAVSSVLARPPNASGTSSFVIRPEKYEGREKFTGISQFSFNLFDGRVYNLTVGYKGPEYSHVDKFVAKFVEGTNLPPVENWQVYVGMDTQMKTLNCADFEVSVFAGGPGGSLNYVSVRDLEAEKRLNDRESKASEKPTPKP